ncbi:hypothetical protein Bca4012_039213 [Brassica carinata]|uniref:C2H2-type domain-containing protein n=1 Tax=Brassica carinata TaxID=52824 RepID=A0A8X7W7G0_BRACI|nr:hypothetical protein Bca52824_007404 [Brassica carinata]
MESYYKCRLCFKSFVNGRALGGHMRSHMPSLHKFSIQEQEEEGASQLSDETESDVSSSSSEGEEGKRNGLRDKHQMMEDNESETESSRNIINRTSKRSKRTRKLETLATKKRKASQLSYKTEPECEPPQSSASDTTTEEDLAFCLMMLSRDKWKNKKNKTSSNREVVEEMETEASEGHKKSSKKGRFTCETCGKVFKSYQALGGHRASHKKNIVSNKTEQRSETEYENVVVVVAPDKRIHECPICLRVFASGQALGGHKRSHGIGNLAVNHHHQVQVESVKQRMIDLNLPAPTEEEEVSVVF